MPISEERIRELGRKYLNDKGLEILEEELDNNKLEAAKIILLGAYDYLWQKGEITEGEAQELYKELDMPRDKASRLRQASGEM